MNKRRDKQKNHNCKQDKRLRQEQRNHPNRLHSYHCKQQVNLLVNDAKSGSFTSWLCCFIIFSDESLINGTDHVCWTPRGRPLPLTRRKV
jgi:hypothetical protein